jgi:hypothetical protein
VREAHVVGEGKVRLASDGLISRGEGLHLEGGATASIHLTLGGTATVWV